VVLNVLYQWERLMSKKKKKAKPVSIKKEKDLILKIDKLTGRIPIGKPGEVIHGKKYKKKAERKKWRNKLKDYK
jgi:hypothetical protein